MTGTRIPKSWVDDEFQFLIGKIMTLYRYYVESLLLRFQFLIGKIMTEDYLLEVLEWKLFQFLIGKIMTNNPANSPKKNKWVSIPHR